MKVLYAVYLESLDQDLMVFTDEAEANERLAALTAEGKSAKLEKFGDYQLCGFEKANGCSAEDPLFWEELVYNNGSYRLTERFCWHEVPEKEGYYADYTLDIN